MATLIESLAALAVFAIGSSASATWVAHASSRSAQAGRRLHALAIATDMEARLRANTEGVQAGDYRYANPARRDAVRGGSDGLAATDIAGQDLEHFRGEIAHALGERAHGQVLCGRVRCVVALRWPGGGLDWGFAP